MLYTLFRVLHSKFNNNDIIIYSVDAKVAWWGFSSVAGCIFVVNLVWHPYTAKLWLVMSVIILVDCPRVVGKSRVV